MKIAYVTTYYAGNINDGWSGTGYHIAQSLIKQSLSLRYIGPLEKKNSFLLKFKQKIYNNLIRKKYLPALEPSVLKYYARQAEKILSKLDYDVVLSPGYFPIAYLHTEKPIVIWGDATFKLLKDYYPKYRNLCNETIKNWDLAEQIAQKKCRLLIYSSRWAAKSAVEDYQTDPSKVRVVPFGANIESNRDEGEIRNLVEARPRDKCKLLFVGVDWIRKGGNIAFKVAKELNQSGLNTELTIVGCEPIIDEPLPDFVKNLGFINKSAQEGQKRINDLFAQSHFLILPSRADATPIVFCEANSFGVPCLARNTGGIPTIIKNGKNGKVFSGDNLDAYCNYIITIMQNYSKYKELALSSFMEYKSCLNWSIAGQTVKRLLQDIV